MREKQPALVVTFHTTTAAMEAEAFCQANALPGRIIPVPREITAGCGLAWRTLPDVEADLVAALDGAGIPWAEMTVLML